MGNALIVGKRDIFDVIVQKNQGEISHRIEEDIREDTQEDIQEEDIKEVLKEDIKVVIKEDTVDFTDNMYKEDKEAMDLLVEIYRHEVIHQQNMLTEDHEVEAKKENTSKEKDKGHFIQRDPTRHIEDDPLAREIPIVQVAGI